MKLTKEAKKEKAKAFAGELKGSSALYFTEYQGLKFTELADLRGKLKSEKVRYKVVKNSIAKHALVEAGFEGDWDALLSGPVGVVYGKGDPIGAVKALTAFGKEFPLLKLKAGWMDRQWFGAAECARLAKIGSRTELLTQLAGALQQSISQVASVLQAPMRDLAFALKAVEDKKKAQPA